MTNLSEILSNVRASSSPTVTVPEKWGQGRATFGGLVVAMMYEKLSASVAEGRMVRSLMVSFVAPVAPGNMDISVKVLREGKSATQVQAMASQNDSVVAMVMASFGGDRESVVSVKSEPAPEYQNMDEIKEFPFIAGLTPDFTQYFDYRYCLGKMPFMGSEENHMGGWIRLREGCEAPATIAEILALLDAWPPATFSKLKKPAAGSSLTWTISFIGLSEATASDWWQYKTNIESSEHGYSHIDAQMWDKDGKAILISRQTVSVFA